MGVIDFRAAAGTGSGVSAGRFRRKPTLDDRGDPALVDAAIKRAKEGDAEALRFLYIRYADNVYGYVTSIVRDEHEAEDITQHVFTKLLTVLPRYEQDRKSTRLNSSHANISYAVFCLKKKSLDNVQDQAMSYRRDVVPNTSPLPKH